MLRRVGARLLCSVTLANGTVLKGDVNPHRAGLLLRGQTILPDGRVYSGSYDAVAGFPLPGSQLEEDGDLYRGEFNAAWQRDGRGEAWLADGTHYVGRFKEDEIVEGVVRIPNGTTEVVFEGTLRDESFVRGTLTQSDFVYDGEFADNQPHGTGRLVFATGATQEGTFHHGKLHGSSCKMRLDGGFVYVGEFLDGQIRRGTLYTPTYTYEGEFNEHGRAHGEGAQTYLANEPRLTFSGIWSNGALVRGVCVDEYGSAVDWQNNSALQAQVLGGATGGGEESVLMNSYCGARLKEAAQLHGDMEKSYAEDAASVAQTTGRFPTRMDLGYEGSIAHENEAVLQAQQRQMHDMERSRESLSERAAGFNEVAAGARGNIIGEINENMAKIQFHRQLGAAEVSAARVDEQFERFMKDFNKPSPSSAPEAAPAGLNIDGNAPWKTFTPSK
ncbi:phosphatidylinositol-4-phosphate 5-kinase related [Novymonas esmeraldas]|uniref:Phosphatidylinositol-4-phosphate 5-kinase related n=1 Tax=Novymonas esmeraldas TaxID=1808958 RepID=A0AAW0F9L8_9TRYP